MEEKKTFLDYVGQIFLIFGFSMAFLMLLCFLFGESAKEHSSMFSLGKEGVGIATMMQYLGMSALIVLLRFIFFTDMLIKNMPVAARAMCMVTLVIAFIVCFILWFGWFPADMWLPWVLFFLCFGVCFAVSLKVTMWKEKLENKKMEEALTRIKQQGETDNRERQE